MSPPVEPLSFEDLAVLFPELPEAARWLPVLRGHAQLIEAAGARVRVSSVGGQGAVRRHYAESLELLRLSGVAEEEGVICTDVGTGGGWPGLVVAAVKPGWQVCLVEPLQKRARLLAEMADTLGLTNVSVHSVRAEEAGRGPLREAAGLVTARAVAELPVLVEYTAPLTAEGGVIALAKGSSVSDELTAAEAALAALGCSVERTTPMRAMVNERLSVVTLRRRGALEGRYPRRPGVPERRPI